MFIKTPPELDFTKAKEHFEKEFLTQLLNQTEGQVRTAAKRANMQRSTLILMMKRHGMREKKGE